MDQISEYLEVEIPFVVGCKGSFQAWASYEKGKELDIDTGMLYDGINDSESSVLPPQEGRIKVKIPLRKMFEGIVIEGKVA